MCSHPPPDERSGDPSDAEPYASRNTAPRTVERVVEESVLRALFPDALHRRAFLKVAGAAGAAAMLEAFFPLRAAQALAGEAPGGLEKTAVEIAFLPITCATPIVMAEALELYRKHGLEATLRRSSAWPVVRDQAIHREVDAAHMLVPMPLALSAGTPEHGATPFVMPASANLNGSAITLHKKHLGKVKGPEDMKGMRLCIPFRYSIHNYLLRYYLASGGVDPEKDVELRVVPPPEMLANLRAGNVDGYIVAEPFNQRAVYDGTGFIHLLTSELWAHHPCCAFAVRRDFSEKMPNTFHALFRAIVDATLHCSKRENRKEIAGVLAGPNYLRQPRIVLEQVLTGRFADGRGGIREVPERIDFDPFPWQSMAVWILTQMKRWKHIRADVDYAQVAEAVDPAAECDRVIEELGGTPRGKRYKTHVIMGRAFDAAKAKEYEASFAIRGS